MSIATELTALQGHISNAYDAVNTKGGTIPANKNMANLDDAILSIQSSANITNGAITEGKSSSGTIPANTFVQISDAILSPNNEQQLSGTRSSYKATIIELSEGKYFVLKRDNSNQKQLNAAICNVANGSASLAQEYAVTTVTLNISYAASEDTHCARLSDNKVLVVFYNENPSDSSKLALFAAVCTISGDVITVGEPALVTTTLRYTSTPMGNVPYVVALSENTAVVKYAATSYYTHAVALDISGASITVGTPAQLDSTLDAPTNNAIYPVSSSSFLCSDSMATCAYSISSGVITQVGSAVTTNVGGNVGQTSTTNAAVKTQRIGGTNYYFLISTVGYAVVSFDGTALSLVESGSYPQTGYYMGAGSTSVLLPLGDNTFFFATLGYITSGGSEKEIFAYKITISGTTPQFTEYGSVDPNITAGSSIPNDALWGCEILDDIILLIYPRDMTNPWNGETYGATVNIGSGGISLIGQLSESTYSAYYNDLLSVVTPGEAIYFFSYRPNNSGNYLKSLFIGSQLLYAPATSKIDGLTAEEITTSTAGDVWVLNTGA